MSDSERWVAVLWSDDLWAVKTESRARSGAASFQTEAKNITKEEAERIAEEHNAGLST